MITKIAASIVGSYIIALSVVHFVGEEYLWVAIVASVPLSIFIISREEFL